jgi:Fe2+ or Zn2+ uptake regulation protein
MRNTQARNLIVEFLRARTKPTTAKEIVEHVAETRPDINKSTVYRFIKALTEDGQLATIQVPGKSAVYEMRSDLPHYHFTCEECEEVVCMGRESSQLKKLVPRGYTVSQEHLVLSGICPACKR